VLLRTGAPWRDLPDHFGPWRTVASRFYRWRRQGVFDRLLAESESAEHDLHCFQAIRRMDEILLSNFMVFHDLVREEPYDLWIGDEAWELDYYLHENPEQKRAAYAWLTDFVGWLPMPDGGAWEAFVTADDNAEMIEHIAAIPASGTGRCSSAIPTTSSPTPSAPACR
jgi:hypothetical protein